MAIQKQQQKPIVYGRWKDIQGEKSWDNLLEPFDLLLKSEILRYGDFVNVCYSALQNDRILCEKSLFQESENLRECGYEIEEYIYSNVRTARSYFGHKSMDTDWIGFIAVCTDENEIRRLGRRDIVVAFRGTSETREWIQDLKEKEKAWRYLPGTISQPNVGVHKGFLGFYDDKISSERSARDTIHSTITSLLRKYPSQTGHSITVTGHSITVTGHSLGGALATMSAYDIKLLHPAIPVTVFTFASPRVGNQAFADHIREIKVNVLRVKVKNDIVSRLPGVFFNEKRKKLVKQLGKIKILRKLEYSHVGIKLSLNIHSSNDLSRKDKLFHKHSINIHLHLIEGYQGREKPFQSSDNGRNYLKKDKYLNMYLKKAEVSCQKDS